MLFEHGADVIESEKERNFYAKFFAGYFFNELVPGVDERLSGFARLLGQRADEAGFSLSRPIVLDPKTAHVTFDLHGYLLGYEDDTGEAGDIMVSDPTANIYIPIEAKFLSNFSVEDDVERWLPRLSRTIGSIPGALVVPCLLLSRTKWDNARRKYNSEGSNARRLLTKFRGRLLVIEWEELVDLCPDLRVQGFARAQLALRKDSAKYTTATGRFTR